MTLLKLSGEAAARGQYEVAYHLLMAALHVALTKQQAAAIERVQPSHHLSRHQAQLRGQTALFDSLAAHVEAVRLRLQSEQQRSKLRR
ncbi:MAG TPA: hypothetical protein VFJ70_04690 [Burkholderiales bacterium]|nr:hypothetical protein [Burkholderiales bacterium]